MEDLKTMMDSKMSIKDINNTVKFFIDSVDKYPDKLKSTFVLLNIIQEGVECIRKVDIQDFNNQLKNRIEDTIKQQKKFSDEYGTHLRKNEEILNILVEKDNQEIKALQKEANELLSNLDNKIRTLVRVRERLLLPEILNEQKATTDID